MKFQEKSKVALSQFTRITEKMRHTDKKLGSQRITLVFLLF